MGPIFMAVVAFCMIVSFTRPSLEYASLHSRRDHAFSRSVDLPASALKKRHMTGMSEFAQPRSQAA
jgi:hypothetical protein